MLRYFKNRRGIVTILGILFALAIILFLCYIAFNTYFIRPSINRSLGNTLSENGIDTSSYQGIKDTAKKRIEDFSRQYEARIENITREK